MRVSEQTRERSESLIQEARNQIHLVKAKLEEHTGQKRKVKALQQIIHRLERL